MGRFGTRQPVMMGFHMGHFMRAAFVTWVVLWVARVFSPAWPGWSFLELDARAAVLRGQVWRFLAYPLLPPEGPVGLFLLLLVGYFLMRRFEARWGWAGMLRFYLVTTIVPGLAWAAAALIHPGGGGPLFGAEPFMAGLVVAIGLVYPDVQFLIFFVLPMRARTFAILAAILTAFWVIYDLPREIGFAFLSLAGMGAAFLYLKHGWRLSRLAPIQALGALPGRLSRAWRRRNVRVVDKDFDRWLDREDDHEVRH